MLKKLLVTVLAIILITSSSINAYANNNLEVLDDNSIKGEFVCEENIANTIETGIINSKNRSDSNVYLENIIIDSPNISIVLSVDGSNIVVNGKLC